MTLVKVSKQVEMMRDDGCESLVDESSSFCERHSIDIPKMNDMFVIHDWSRRNP